MPSPAVRDTLRSGPTQLFDESTIRILLVMLIIMPYSVLSVRTEEFFSVVSATKSTVVLGDNWPIFVILRTEDSFSWMFSSLYWLLERLGPNVCSAGSKYV